MTSSSLYSYPNSNSSIINSLNLAKHPEGGYYIETKILEELIPSPHVGSSILLSLSLSLST